LYLGLPVIGVSSPGNTAYFSSTSFTATSGQTTFTPSGSYQVGFINVIRNGSQLAPADYTATNGTTVTLLNPCVAGDVVVLEVYTLTSISNALPLTGGTVTGATTFNTGVTVNGMTVGRGGGSVATNTVVGASALNANTTGNNGTAVGFEALKLNTTGVVNTALGANALAANTTGSQNTAVGDGALQSNTTASFNTAVGRDAMEANTTGTNNTALGWQALLFNTTASNNTAVGYQAGVTNTVSSYNTFLGVQAGYTYNGANANTWNTCVGGQAGYFLTTGTYNSFLGTQAGQVMTTGSKNTIVGAYNGNQGGLDIRTSSNNIIISDGDGTPRKNFLNVGNVTTSAVRIGANNGIGGLYFITAFNTTGGAQGWWLVAVRDVSVTTISSANGTGLTVTFSQSGGNNLFMQTSSGTLSVVAHQLAG